MKKNKKFILILLLISLVFSFLIEIFVFNYKVLTKNKKYEPKIIEKHDVTKDGNWYKSTTNKAYIIIKTDNKNQYVNKLTFDYKINRDLDWKTEYKNNNKKVTVINKSSSFTNKAIKPIKSNTDQIKISFNHKNFRIKNIEVNNKIYINLSRIIFITILLLGIGILIEFRDYFYKNIDKAFLLIVLSCGALFILVFPKNVYISWDDQIHLKKSYTLINNGDHSFSTSFKVLESMGAIDNLTFRTREEKLELYKSLNKLHKETKQDKIQTNATIGYNKLIYLPFSIGFIIAETLGFSFIGMVVFSKLMNFLLYVLLIYMAIKIIPFAKKLIFLIGLLPANIYLASQFSYDPTITASIILGIAIFLKMLTIEKINYRYIMAFVLAIIWASLPKAVYCPLLLLLLFIPNKKFNSKKEGCLVKTIIVIITTLLLATFILPTVSSNVGGDVRGGNTSVSGQLKFVLASPLSFVILLIKFFSVNGVSLALGERGFVDIAYLNSYISLFQSAAYMIALILMFYTLYAEPINKKALTPKIKTIFAIAYAGISILIAAALYLSFTEVGSNVIEGVQPRYFSPLLLMLLMIISATTNKKTKESKNNILVLLIPFGLLLLTMLPVVVAGRGI
ncbi:MAG: DUF2142 domain-containing protein [Bacilli bacterium]|nr:DUF2142 domain-containing protein [Bacilli bacterium]